MKELAHHMLDIAENCIAAGAGRVKITMRKDAEQDLLFMAVEDDGRGIPAEDQEKVTNPFHTSRTTRKVGLGLPLLKQQAEASGGSCLLKSRAGEGTLVEASFGWSHPDRQPLGDLEGCWILLASSHADVEWELECESEKGKFAISTSEIRMELGVDGMQDRDLRESLKRLIRNNIQELALEYSSLTGS